MNGRRVLAGTVLGLALGVAAPATAAVAAPAYPPGGGPEISLSGTVIRVGGQATVCGTGYRARSAVAVRTTRLAGTAARPDSLPAAGPRTSARGGFCVRLRFARIGTFRVTGAGVGADGVPAAPAATISVVGGLGVSDGDGLHDRLGAGLPNTGASLELPVLGGLVLILAGVVLVRAARDRSPRSTFGRHGRLYRRSRTYRHLHRRLRRARAGVTRRVPRRIPSSVPLSLGDQIVPTTRYGTRGTVH